MVFFLLLPSSACVTFLKKEVKKLGVYFLKQKKYALYFESLYALKLVN